MHTGIIQWKPFWLAIQLYPQRLEKVTISCEIWRISTGPNAWRFRWGYFVVGTSSSYESQDGSFLCVVEMGIKNSHQITKVKHHRAGLVPAWVTSPGTPRAPGNSSCTRHMVKPRLQVGRVCQSHHQYTPQFTTTKCDWSLELEKKK